MVRGSRLAITIAIVVLGLLPVNDGMAAAASAQQVTVQWLVQNGQGRDGHGMENRREGLISRDRAARIARSASDGRVLRVQLHGGNRPWYRVKVLVDGQRVRAIRIDARSGRVLD